MRLGIIGGGNLAQSLIAGLRRQSRIRPKIVVVDRNYDKRQVIAALGHIGVTEAIGAAVLDVDVLVLAVKPHDLEGAASKIAEQRWRPLVVSVAGGVPPRLLTTMLNGHTRVVWAMPNTPAAVGRAVTGLYAHSDVKAEDRLMAEALFSAVGTTLWVDHEDMMAALTAVSGCGPAYVYFLIEALERAARELGFTPASAARIATQTFSGALSLLELTQAHPAELRAQVTTKRGITEQAIQTLQAAGCADALVRAVETARARALAVSEQLASPAQHSLAAGA